MPNRGTLRTSLRAFSLLAALLFLGASAAEAGTPITVYRSPTCGCCEKWAKHLETSGFDVELRDVQDMGFVKQSSGVPTKLSACHTAVVGDYVIEGHVPAEDIVRLLEERPEVVGLAVPGMPEGSPGMEGPRPERYEVWAFSKDGRATVFSTHGP